MIMLFNTNDYRSAKKLRDYIDHINTESDGKPITYIVEITKNRPVRSIKQNRYYRAILKCIAGPAGYDMDRLHDMYKKKFNGEWILDELVGRTTTNLDSKEFTVYVNKVKNHGREFFGAYIPEPEDKNYLVWEMATKNNYDKMFASI